MAESSEHPKSATAIEQTSKRLKLQQLVSVIMIIVGGVMLFAQIDAADSPPTVPVLLLVIGLFWYAVTRIRMWWHHG